MKVIVDYNLCETNARCVSVAPEVFEVNEDEDKMYIIMEEPSEELRGKVDNAVRLCPKQALRIED
ncbi:MAG: ferredoxin [Acidimicrobiia bacterium]